jgi:hypothetical protein
MRFEDWPRRLDDYLREHERRPFAWGSHDCCTFAACCVEALTGENPMRRYRYRTERGALRALARDGGLERAVAVALAGREIPPLTAQRGDVVLFTYQGQPVVGVCVGTHIASPGPAGLSRTPISAATRAWRV